jgi:phage tail-like protein
MKATRIKRLLPYNYQEAAEASGPVATILAVMEELHAQPEAVLSQLDTYFDPYRAPDDFIPFLASWVDLEVLLDRSRSSSAGNVSFRTGTGRLRELIQAAATLSRWRGTRKGLLLFLETATGLSGFTIDEESVDEQGVPVPFHLRITAPAESSMDRSLLEHIIELEKPAYVTYELLFMDAPRVP